MIFHETPLAGAFLVEIEPHQDERGYFARTFCQAELAARGLDPRCVQGSVSYNKKKGTLRGLHYQRAPFAETKLVSCLRGAIYDVLLDLRPGSPTYGGWTANFLTENDGPMLYVPAGVAHGFQTLTDDVVVSYQMSERYSPAHAEGIRFDDPIFGIRWPLPKPILSDRDASYPDFAPIRPCVAASACAH